MPGHALRPLFTALVLLVAEPASAVEVLRIERINWLSADPPAVVDRKVGGGLAAKMVAFIRLQWPEVQHRIVQANAKRSWQMLVQGEPACHASMLHTPERESLACFSNTQMSRPLQLIVRRDKLLGERPGHKALVYDPASDFGSKILPMLSMARGDYTVEQDLALSVGRELNPQLDELLSLPIQGASELLPAGVACPRNAWGLAAIREIDKRLGTPARAAMLRKSFERWLTPEVRQHYGARIDAFYKARAKPSVIR